MTEAGAITVFGEVLVLVAVAMPTACAERNLNNSCDTNELTSAKTGSESASSFSYAFAGHSAAAALPAERLPAKN